MSWTDQAVAVIKTQWTEGRSASQIANSLRLAGLGVFSRNAVIGKLHRIGLAGEGAGIREKASAPQTRAPRPPRKVNPAPRSDGGVIARGVRMEAQTAIAQAPVKIGSVWPVSTTAKTTLELASRECRFPVGPDTSFEQLYCGEATNEGEVYCACHQLIAYAPRADSKRASYDRMFLRTAGL